MPKPVMRQDKPATRIVSVEKNEKTRRRVPSPVSKVSGSRKRTKRTYRNKSTKKLTSNIDDDSDTDEEGFDMNDMLNNAESVEIVDLLIHIAKHAHSRENEQKKKLGLKHFDFFSEELL